MKALIAATCLAVIAAVGYFFYGEYAEAQARAERTAERAEMRSQVFEDAGADPGDYSKVRRHCQFARDNLKDWQFGEYARYASSRCTQAGF